MITVIVRLTSIAMIMSISMLVMIAMIALIDRNGVPMYLRAAVERTMEVFRR
jgi:hypothetical protein